ncbi:MAG: hypothetical protein ACK5VI_02685 [Opitutia bacterium]
MGNNFEHFAAHAPQDIREALKSFTEYAAGELDGLVGAECFGEAQVGEVNGVGYDGFIPYQLGGYVASLFIRFDTDPSYHLTEGMTQAADDTYKQAYEAAMGELELPTDTEWGALTDEQREVVFDTEQEWFNDGALLQFECWLEGEPYDADAPLGNIMMRVSVNYRDAPYFRDKYAEDIYTTELSIEALRIAVKQWPDDWQARLWRELLSRKAGA